MDFHSLTRRELQILCKKNKIPANITNIAMADALQSLHVVEGIEDLLKLSDSETAHSSVESPKKNVISSPIVPRTGCRTSTRQKPIKEESESSKVSARTRRAKTDDVAETPAMPSSRRRAPVRRKMETQLKEEGDDDRIFPETPAVATSTRCRKMEGLGDQKDRSSVQLVYSTRRSTRLLGKQMMDLNLNDKEEIERVQFEASDKEMGKDFGKELEDKGMYDLLVKSGDLEAPLDKKSDALSKNVSELEDNVQEHREEKCKVDNVNVKLVQTSDDHMETLTFKKDKDDDDKDDDGSQTKSAVGCERSGELDIVSGENLEISSLDLKEDDDDDGSQTKSEVGCERAGELDIVSGENLEICSLDLKEGSVDSGFDKFISDIENSTERLVSENGERLNANKDLGLEDSAAVVISSVSVCSDVFDPVVALPSSMLQQTNHSVSEEPIVGDLVSTSTWSVSAAADQQQNIEVQNPAHEESVDSVKDQNTMGYNLELNDVRDLELGLATKESFDEKAPCDDDAETEIVAEAFEVQDIKSTLINEDMSEDEVLSDDAEVNLYHHEHSVETSDTETLSCGEDESSTEEESDSEKSDTTESAEQDIESSNEEESDSEKSDTKESAEQVAIDIAVEEIESEHAVTAHECPSISVNQINSCPVISETDMVEQIAGQESMKLVDLIASSHPSSDKTPCPDISSADIPVDMPISTQATDPLPCQMSTSLLQLRSNSDHVSCAASLTPLKKSSSKTPTTSRKFQILLDENKENIDNSGKKLELTKEKRKKDKKKSAVGSLLDDTSVRQLKKMLKEKLKISNNKNINEEKNAAKVERARPALQTLSENCLAATGPENEN